MSNTAMIRLALTLVPMFVGWAVTALKDGKIDIDEWIELARMVARQLGVTLEIPDGHRLADQRNGNGHQRADG